MCSASRRRGFGCAGQESATPRRSIEFCSRWEVARYTARIPHPYPPGSAERFIYAAREANASGRDLTLVMTPIKGKRDAIGSISLEIARQGPPGARLRAHARGLGQGPRHRGRPGDDRRRLRADAGGRDPGERHARERSLASRAGKVWICAASERACKARRRAAAWSNATASAWAANDWAAAAAARHEASAGLAPAS